MHMVNVTPIVGLPQFSGWAQVYTHTFSPGLECVVTIAIQGPQAGTTGKLFLEQVTAAPPVSAEHLYETLEEAKKQAEDRQCQISTVLIYFTQSQSTLIAYNATVLLKRGDKVGKIILPHREISQVEGVLKSNDVFVAVTDSGQQFIETIEQQFAAGYDSDGVVTTIVPAVHAAPDTASAAFAFMTVPPEPLTSDPDGPAVLTQKTEEVDTYNSLSLDTTEAIVGTQERVKEKSIPVRPLDAPLDPEPGPSVREQLLTTWQAVSSRMRSLIRVLSSKSHAVRAAIRGKETVVPVLSLKQKRVLLGTGIALALLSAVIIGVVIKTRYDQQRAEELVAPYRQRLLEVQEAALEDPLAARSEVAVLLDEVKTAELAVQEGTQAEQDAFTALVSDITLLETDLSGKEDVSELPVFYDIRLAVPDALTSVAAVSGATAVFIDTGKATAVLVNIETKQAEVVTDPAFGRARAVVGRDDGSFVVLADGLQEFTTANPEQLVQLKEEGDSNREAQLVGSFGTFLYVLNAEKRNLYRYALQEDEYSDPIGWLRDPLGVPYESVTSLAIDGEVWIGSNTGEIKRFASGATEDFSISGMEEPFSEELHLYTVAEFENLYVLEPDASRIVVLSKTGQFLRQIESPALAAATELLVSENEQTGYVVSGSLIYEIQL